MAEADKDGRMAQVVGDLHTTTSMALAEHALEAAVDFDREMAKVQAVIDGGGSNLAALRRVAATMAQPCIADQDPWAGWGDQA